MNDQIQPLAGQRAESGESDNAVIACNDWLRMGPGRSLPALVEKYTAEHYGAPPTTKLNTLKRWSSDHDWAARATAFDANYEQIKSEQRARVMNYGAALDFERVTRLKHLADFLEAQIYERDDEGRHCNIWVKDVKQIGSGDDAYSVDIFRFNGGLLSEYRNTLNDIAKEVGGRTQKVQHSGDENNPLQIKAYIGFSPDDWDDDDSS